MEKKRTRISPRNKRKQKSKKVRKEKKYSEPKSSEVETSETEEIKSDAEDIPKTTHPQLSDSTEEDFEVKNKSEQEENEIKSKKEQKKKEDNINEETSSSNLSPYGKMYKDINSKKVEIEIEYYRDRNSKKYTNDKFKKLILIFNSYNV